MIQEKKETREIRVRPGPPDLKAFEVLREQPDRKDLRGLLDLKALPVLLAFQGRLLTISRTVDP